MKYENDKGTDTANPETTGAAANTGTDSKAAGSEQTNSGLLGKGTKTPRKTVKKSSKGKKKDPAVKAKPETAPKNAPKLRLLKLGATIPTMQYGNIQPELEIEGGSLAEASEVGLNYLKELHLRFGESELKERGREQKIGFAYQTTTVTTKSFNEDSEIVFEPLRHIYQHNGNDLTSATRVVEQFYKPFDSQKVSSVCAPAWGVEQSEILSFWESNGKISSGLGNLVHNLLDHINTHELVGIAAGAKIGENKAIPRHPLLRSIYDGFVACEGKLEYPDGAKLLTEVLLSDVEAGFVGTADRLLILDQEKKTCRVGDIKVNIESETEDKKKLTPLDERFKDLPPTKLTKYQLQMSIYANMLEKSGWTVEGLDVFVLEEEWKHFALPVLQVLC